MRICPMQYWKCTGHRETRCRVTERPGTWWRFESYEVRDGLIRPASGARLIEYEPWHDYLQALERRHPASGAKRIHAPAYESLVNLAIEIDVEHSDGAWHLAPPSDQARVLDWVNAHGLLGILPHVTEAVIMPLAKQGDRPHKAEGSPAVAGLRYDRRPDGTWLEASRRSPARDGAAVRRAIHGGAGDLEESQRWPGTARLGNRGLSSSLAGLVPPRRHTLVASELRRLRRRDTAITASRG